MRYMEQKKIVHRDIGLRNFLIREQDGEPYFVKIADFGLSRSVGGDYYSKGHDTPIPIKWTAPEAIRAGKWSIKSDVWSFGIMLWELFSRGDKPYYQFS